MNSSYYDLDPEAISENLVREVAEHYGVSRSVAIDDLYIPNGTFNWEHSWHRLDLPLKAMLLSEHGEIRTEKMFVRDLRFIANK